MKLLHGYGYRCGYGHTTCAVLGIAMRGLDATQFTTLENTVRFAGVCGCACALSGRDLHAVHYTPVCVGVRGRAAMGAAMAIGGVQ